jgi:Zn-dependent protease with chaperone function
MPFLLLFLVILTCLPEDWQPPPAWLGLPLNLALFSGLTWLGVAGVAAVSAVLTYRVRRLLQRHPDRREALLRRYGSWRLLHLLGVFAYSGVALYFLGWGWTVRSLGPLDEQRLPQLLPGAEALLLAPVLAALVLSWAFFYDVDRALHETAPPSRPPGPAWGRWAYVGFQIRQYLALIVAPIVLLVLVKGLRREFPEYQQGPAFQATAMGLLAAVFVGLPWILRLVLGLKPLPAGPLRDRLVATARRLRFRYSNLLLWDTHGSVANAMVAGLLPFPRYVLFTDRLIQELTPDEVDAVFGHEIGHVKHLHMIYYLGFLLASTFAVGALWDLTDLETRLGKDWAAVPVMASLGAYIFVVFGFLSRRCERQADLFGCRSVSCAQRDCAGHEGAVVLSPKGRGLCPTGIRTFIEALEKVARVNGISRKRPGWLQSWQHSTIARRVGFLQQVLADPALAPRFQRRIGLVKLGLLVLLGAALWVLVKHPGVGNASALLGN